MNVIDEYPVKFDYPTIGIMHDSDPEIETTKKVLCRMQAMAVRMEAEQ